MDEKHYHVLQNNLSVIEVAEDTRDTLNDKMLVKCYLVEEGVNGNGFKLPRDLIINNYKTFLEKPVFINPDTNGYPTGHGFDKTNNTFTKDRQVVGTISDVDLAIVKENDEVVELKNANSFDEFISTKGQIRVIGTLTIWKYYFPNITEKLDILHLFKKLRFSMEAMTDVIVKGAIRECTKIKFLGLAIVSRPAFANSKSVEITTCELKGETGMNKDKKDEKLENVKDDVEDKSLEVVDENDKEVEENLEPTNEEKDDEELDENENAEVINKLQTTIAELQEQLKVVVAENESLKEIKADYDKLCKERLGQERLEKLSKFEHDKTAMELAELTDVDFANVIIDLANEVKATPSVTQATYEHTSKNSIEVLTKFFKGGK